MKAKHIFGLGSKQIKLMYDGTLRFKYAVDDVCGCEFSLFSEVGEPYQAGFKRLMKEHSLMLGDPKELDQAPWYADTLKGN
jgi:hypothetical protein